MARPYKIKRNNRIYRTRRFSVGGVFKWLFICLLGAGLVFFGFSIAGPMLDFITGKNTVSVSSSAPSESQESSSSQQESSSSQPTQQSAIKGTSITMDTLADSAKLTSFISDAKNQGINTVMVTLKDSAGIVYYPSKLPKVTQYGALSPSAVDITSAIATLKQNGIKVIGEIYAFQDPVACYGDRSMAVKYQGSEMLWLDNYKEKGGKPWLDPYNTDARAYITSIAAEIAGLGVDAVSVRAVQFPTGVTTSATYPDSNNVSKEQALTSFTTELKSALSSAGAQLVVTLPASAAVGNLSGQYSTTPLAVSADYVAVDVDLSLMSNNMKVGDTVIASPSASPFDATNAVLKKVSSDLSSGGMKMMVILTGSGDSATEQIKAMTANSVSDYILKS